MGELAGRVALVTGAGRGLGAAIGEVFLREGASVVLSDIGWSDAQLAERLPGRARRIRHDVTDAARWRQVRDHVFGEFGALDILVNNAGLAGIIPFDETSEAQWQKLIGVMQTGPYLGMHTLLPDMVKAGSGAIVNIASTNAIRGMAATAAYTAAKHGVLGLTRALALEYAPAGIRINAVCPGAMWTEMLRESMDDNTDAFATAVPLGRAADPREVAEVVSFLASARASYCTGATFVADGGLTVG